MYQDRVKQIVGGMIVIGGLVMAGFVLFWPQPKAQATAGSYSPDAVDWSTMIIKTVASAATPEQLAVTGGPCRAIAFFGYKAVRTPNVGTVWLQFGSLTNDTVAIPVASGTCVSFASPNGLYWPTNIFVDCVTAGDGVLAVPIQ